MKDKLVKLLLDYEFWETNRGLIVPEMFPDITRYVYEALVFAHSKYKRTLKIDELHDIVLMNNPALTTAQKDLIKQVMGHVQMAGDIGPDVAKDVMAATWREEIGRRISNIGLDIIDGKASMDDLTKLVELNKENFVPDDAPKPVTTDVDELLAQLSSRRAWKINIPSIEPYVTGLSAGEFCILFGRVESGKTGAHVSLACAPGGFAWQGAKVHVLVNEEPAVRTMLRCISSCTGMTREEIETDPRRAADEWAKIKNNITIIDDVDMTMTRLNSYVKNKRPDVLIIDQLDKVFIDGSFVRKDEMLGEVYQMAREIGKRHECAVIGITQASFAAEGKTQVHFSMMAESRTSKAAEADLVLGIGKDSSKPLDDPERFITISKNKITGIHLTKPCLLHAQISRFVA